MVEQFRLLSVSDHPCLARIDLPAIEYSFFFLIHAVCTVFFAVADWFFWLLVYGPDYPSLDHKALQGFTLAMNYIDTAHGLTFCWRVAGDAKPTLRIDPVHDACRMELVVSGGYEHPQLLGLFAFRKLAEGYVYYGRIDLIY